MPSIVGVIPEHVRRRIPPADRQIMGKAALTMSDLEAKAAVRLEREIHAKFSDYLRLNGVTFGHARMDRRTGYTEGWPDFSWVSNGRACYVEVKLPGEKPRPNQEQVMAGLAAAGAFVRVVYSLQEAIEAFRESQGMTGGKTS